MKKRGFTLVELLAVVAIIAVLVIIALPNVLNLFNDAKKSSFETEVKNIYSVAEKEYVNDSLNSSGNKIYAYCKNDNCGKNLKLSGGRDVEYLIEFDSSGKVIKYFAKNGSYQYSYIGDGLKITEISDSKLIADLKEEDKITITSEGVTGYNTSYFNDKYCVFVENGEGIVSKDYFPFRSGMTWAEFHDYLLSSSDLEGYRFNLDSVWDKSLNQYYPGDPYFDTYYNDPESHIYYSLSYKDDNIINWYLISKYGEYWETYDGFGVSEND